MALKTNKSKPKNKPLGFTIVELLIVIVIIGILAAITIVSYIGLSKKATEASLASDLDGAKRQLELYKTEHETYPTTMDENKCPTAPVNDTKYCLKSKDFQYTTTDNGLTYTLKLTKADIAFEVTNDSTPKLAEVVPVEPTLPESDWITIGTQRWARKNLNVGAMILGTADPVQDSNIEKYCYGNNEANCMTYGGLYRWNEAMDWVSFEGAKGICPTGSHIPSDNDWKILEIQLGMTQAEANADSYRGSNEGEKMKIGGNSGLEIPFAGFRYLGGSFEYLSSRAYLWSSSEPVAIDQLWIRMLDVSDARSFRYYGPKYDAFSVRCLGD